jgi:platelet-activating factor acetylhydrolase IB subunit alpha
MVLTDRQREDLHAGIYEYLKSRGEAFASAAEAFAVADPVAAGKTTNNVGTTPLLEKKWTAIPRLQKKVLELERILAQNAKIHAHRMGVDGGAANGGSVQRRMLPRLPCAHTLQGHAASVTCVQVHPVFTVVVSGSEDGTIKVRTDSIILQAGVAPYYFGMSSAGCPPTHPFCCRHSNYYLFRSGIMKVETT